MGLSGSPVGLLVVFTCSVICNGLTHSLVVLLVCSILAFILENKALSHPRLDKIRRVLGVKAGFGKTPVVSDSKPTAGLSHGVSQLFARVSLSTPILKDSANWKRSVPLLPSQLSSPGSSLP